MCVYVRSVYVCMEVSETVCMCSICVCVLASAYDLYVYLHVAIVCVFECLWMLRYIHRALVCMHVLMCVYSL